MKKGFSIITNFGCNQNCWYCIWNKHPLKDVHNDTDWNKLECALALFPQEKISISGGGDPLYNFEDNTRWYERLFFLCEKHNKQIDIHTSEIKRYDLIDDFHLFNKYVIHINFKRFKTYKKVFVDRFASCIGKLRLAVVLTPDLTLLQSQSLINFAKDYSFKLSFREYISGSISSAKWTDEMNKILELVEKESDENIKFIDQDDYNVYYMPDNHIYTNFFCFEYGKIA